MSGQPVKNNTLQRLCFAARQKARNASGDSLVEAIAAILIAALGAALLATMVMSSASATMRNQERLSALYTAESTLASPSGGTEVTVVIQSGSLTMPIEIPALLYSEDEYIRYEPKAE
ncbi:MAG: hypothetical protein RSB04_02395 [Gordonibacter sp.]|uniref:hypothetical protein n=1 Tax=Gordonibacter sp. TaxID=1968902 RepID=UPI002FC66902